jgi:hypothetical protein
MVLPMWGGGEMWKVLQSPCTIIYLLYDSDSMWEQTMVLPMWGGGRCERCRNDHHVLWSTLMSHHWRTGRKKDFVMIPYSTVDATHFFCLPVQFVSICFKQERKTIDLMPVYSSNVLYSSFEPFSGETNQTLKKMCPLAHLQL